MEAHHTQNAGAGNYPAAFLRLLPELEERIHYHFRDQKLLYTALTHSSFSNEKKFRIHFEYNERLEFLGDSVLSLIVSRHIFASPASFPEGILTKLRAATVCADALFEFAQSIELGKYMLLNHGLEQDGGRRQKNILADCFEALIAAIFLDGGLEEAEKFVLGFAEKKLHELTLGGRLHDEDYKSLLQQKVQTSPGERVEYLLIGETGPDHHKEFTVQVCLNSNIIGTGSGRSKREAEQLAAKNALCDWFGQKS